jgi:hypothetical protein
MTQQQPDAPARDSGFFPHESDWCRVHRDWGLKNYQRHDYQNSVKI